MSYHARTEAEAPVRSGISPFRGRFEPRSFTLPAEAPTPLVGRERELNAVNALIRNDHIRLLTITGPGGIGKTRLAIRLAHELNRDFDDGAAFVPLATAADPVPVTALIAQALRLHESESLQALPQVCFALADREVLLVLDNLERVQHDAADVSALLTACPYVKILATSRAPLHITGEQEFAIPTLELPDVGVFDLIDVARFPAVALFVQRARAVKADFVLDETNAAAIVAICRRLDGLPLAIELAAARTKVLSPHALLARLTRGLDVLTGGPQDQPGRLQTLRAAISWSYDFLSPEEQQCFDYLAVFTGGFSLVAAEAVMDSSDATAVLNMVASLADSNLLRIDEDGDGEPRFGMLETIREFGLERLEASGKQEVVRDRHASSYLDLADEAWPAFVSRLDLERWIARFETDHDNFRSALKWTIENNRTDTALRLAGRLSWFWYLRGYLAEGRSWLERALAESPSAVTSERATALYGVATIAHWQGDDARAQACLEQALPIWEDLNDRWGATVTLGMLGTVAEDKGDYEAAAPWYQQALDQAQAADDQPNIALTLDHLGIVNWGLGNGDAAIALWEEALTLQRTLGDSWGAAISFSFLGLIASERGEFDRAENLLRESLRLRWQIGNKKDIPLCIANIATLAVARGDFERAALLFGATETVRIGLGHTMKEPEHSLYARSIVVLRTKMEASQFSAAWEIGRARSLSEAVVEAMSETSQRDAMGSEPGPGILTPREHDVLQLLVKGFTDREIADALFISPRTAQGHVARLFDKLGVNTRTAAVAAALTIGLLDESSNLD